MVSRIHALLLASSLLAPVAAMAAPQDPPQIDHLPMNNPLTRNHTINISAAAAEATRDMGLARSALVNGDPEVALKLLLTAKGGLGEARHDGTSFSRSMQDLRAEENSLDADPDKVTMWIPVGGHYLKPVAPNPAEDMSTFKALLVPISETQQALDKVIGMVRAHQLYPAIQDLRTILGWTRMDTVLVQRSSPMQHEQITLVGTTVDMTAVQEDGPVRVTPPPTGVGEVTISKNPNGGFTIRTFARTRPAETTPEQDHPGMEQGSVTSQETSRPTTTQAPQEVPAPHDAASQVPGPRPDTGASGTGSPVMPDPSAQVTSPAPAAKTPVEPLAPSAAP